MEEVAYMVCMRVDELSDPVEDSTKTACVECGDDIWISPASRTKMREVKGMPVCSRCAMRIAQENPTEVRGFGTPSDAQFEEIIQNLREQGLGDALDAAFDPSVDNFEALKRTATLAAKAFMTPDSDWGSMVVMVDYNGFTFPPCSLTQLFEKGIPKEVVAKQLIPGMVQASAAEKVYFGFSSWTLSGEGPAPEGSLEHHPDRKEALVLLEVTADGVQRMSSAEITRDGVNPPALGEWHDSDTPSKSAGLFVETLVPTLQLVRSQRES